MKILPLLTFPQTEVCDSCEEKRRETHVADGEAVPTEVLGLFHSLLAQEKPGSSPLQAGICEHCGRGESTLESPGVEVAEPEDQR